MKPEAQRLAIAEACGYSAEPNEGSIGGFIGRHPNGQHDYYTIGRNWADAIRRICPDYLNDLNAMHEAEENIRHDHDSWGKYLVFLSRSAPECRVFSTAAQRAEAFLRTLGKWEEAEQ